MNKKILLVAIIILALDQISKAIIDITMKFGQSIKVINNFFSLSYYKNTGAAWGMFHNLGPILIIISLVVLLIIYHYMYKFKLNRRNIIAFGLLFGGIIGNLLDRFILGYVRDFLDFYILGYDFPVFNISDCAIVIGIILLIIAIIKGEEVSGKDSSK